MTIVKITIPNSISVTVDELAFRSDNNVKLNYSKLMLKKLLNYINLPIFFKINYCIGKTSLIINDSKTLSFMKTLFMYNKDAALLIETDKSNEYLILSFDVENKKISLNIIKFGDNPANNSKLIKFNKYLIKKNSVNFNIKFNLLIEKLINIEIRMKNLNSFLSNIEINKLFHIILNAVKFKFRNQLIKNELPDIDKINEIIDKLFKDIL